jgi:hypothetical protein
MVQIPSGYLVIGTKGRSLVLDFSKAVQVAVDTHGTVWPLVVDLQSIAEGVPMASNPQQDIWKIQVPLNDPTAPALVYNQSRSKLFYLALADVQGFFKPGEVKVYVKASFSPATGQLTDIKLVEPQPW